jgi:hypothetical protein
MTEEEYRATREMMSKIREAYSGIARWAAEYPGIAARIGTYERIAAIMRQHDEMALALEQAGYYER